jgi:6-phosphogluconolactonase
MSPPPVRVVDSEALTREATAWLARALREALAARPRVSFALSGGSTPVPIYRALAGLTDIAWARVDFYFADERCVPPEHPDSNYRLAREAMLAPLNAADAQVFRMEGERTDRDAAARDYEARLPPVLDVVLLGLGEDGHTASLFPGHPALEERTRRVLAIANSPKPPPERLTLTLPALLSARAVLGVTAGAGKRDAVRRMLAGEDLPAARVHNAEWLVDRTAAGA